MGLGATPKFNYNMYYLSEFEINYISWLDVFSKKGYEYDAVINNTIHESSAESDVLGSNFQLYDSHIPTSILQKAVLTAGSAIMALYDPTRAGRKINFWLSLSIYCLCQFVWWSGQISTGSSFSKFIQCYPAVKYYQNL